MMDDRPILQAIMLATPRVLYKHPYTVARDILASIRAAGYKVVPVGEAP